MGRPSRFDHEFRAHAVELVKVSRRSRSQVASDLGVSDTTLGKWMTDSAGSLEPDPLTISERAELVMLRSEKREWILEREILKKSTAFWVKESHA